MPEQSATLRDMIQKALDGGETYRSLASRAVDPLTKKTASYGLISNIMLKETRSAPDPSHLRAIAVALRVPYESVRQAAIAQWLPALGEEDAEREKRLLLAGLVQERDRADAAIAQLEMEMEQEDRDGGRRAG